MNVKAKKNISKISIEAVKRVLDVGHLLISVLTANEVKELKFAIEQNKKWVTLVFLDVRLDTAYDGYPI